MKKQTIKEQYDKLRFIHRSVMLGLLCLSLLYYALPVQASVYAQEKKLTLDFKSVPLSTIFDAIKKQSEFSFWFEMKDVNLKQLVTIKVKDALINQVLDIVLKNQPVKYEISGKLIRIKSASELKTKNVGSPMGISGVVKDSKGETLIGATVTIKGTNIGTLTDMNGNFKIQASPNATLIFSYIGYETQEMRVKNDGFINIGMQENLKMLDEVVVVGYGTQKKANLTGAIGYVSGKKLENRPVSSLGQALQGVVPNMNVSFASGKPGETTRINIRGAGSIHGNDAPLILIDGVEGSIDNLNPHDVESISVLKDASSAAIYGARAAFGVILVTTKSASEGKMKVSYNGRFSFSKQTTRSDYLTTGYDAVVMLDEFYRSFNGTKDTKYDSEDMIELEARRYDVTEHPDRPWVIEKNGRYMYYANFDWYNYLFDATRPTWNHNISISGGTKKFNYNVSGNIYTQTGIYNGDRPDKFKSGNIRARIKSELTPWMNFSITSSLNVTNYWAPGIDNNMPNCTFGAFPFMTPVNPDGTNVYNSQITNGNPTGGLHIAIKDGSSFIDDNKKTYLNSANVELKLYKGLTLNANYSYQFYYNDRVGRTNTNTYSQTPGVIEVSEGLLTNKLRQTCDRNSLQVADVFFNYENSFSGHNLRAILGGNYETYYSKRIYATKLGIQSEVLNDFNLGDNSKVLLGGENSAGQAEYALLGFFGRLGYDYKGIYLAELNIRRDATSRFPKRDRAGYFPSVSLGWRVSEESFFNPLKNVISNLKLRGSYGALGNQKTSSYYPYVQTMKVTQMGGYIFDGGIASYTNSGDPLSGSLTWESIYSTNIGLDLGFLNGRLSFSGDLYKRDTKGMLMPGVKLPSVFGATEPMENGAELRTKGFEIELAWNDNINVLGKNLNYYISASLADNTTTVTKYTQNPNKQLSGAYEGMEWGEIWGYQVDGLFASNEAAKEYGSRIDQSLVNQNIFVEAQGSYKGLQGGDMIFADLDGSKKIDNGINTLADHGDLKKIGNRLPRYTFSCNLGFSWYGVDFSAFLQGIGRQNIYPSGDCMAFWGGYARPYSSFIPKDFASDMWTPENPNAYYPKQRGYAAQGNRSLAKVNNRYLQDLGYCRLKNITVGYTFPSSWTKKVFLERVRFYFSGDNVVTWTKLRSEYIDPEQFASDGNARVYPYPKTFSFGIDITL